jgi:hypothetical protein
MSQSASYTFLPWLRQGIANQISGQSGQRATIPLELRLKGDKTDGSGVETRPPIPRNIEIYGPGDVVGLEPRAIIKVEPHDWLTNFEPNYLPYIDFYDEDLPWRYSPLVPNGHRLTPWLMLVVLEDGEFENGQNAKDRPLPYLRTTPQTRLPPSDQLWAWAHVHVNQNLIGSAFVSTDRAAIETQLASVLKANADAGYSRIVCPRRLKPNTAYHAFLVPAFESGRLAGLGQDPSGAPSFDTMAWSDGAVPLELPFYHRWYFRSGDVGDFEYLVRLLKPQPIDSRVGTRDIDVQRPGANLRGIVDAPGAPETEQLGGVLKLGGALRIPDAFYTPEEFAIVEKYRSWATLAQPYPHPFQASLAAFVNLTDDYARLAAEQANQDAEVVEEQVAANPSTEYDIGQNPDPLITAPLYGRWHALTQRLLKDAAGADAVPNDNWVHELNLDPRWRSAAGFGTGVVQDNQEDYMKAAWDQVGKVLETNQRIRYGQLALQASTVWYSVHLAPQADPATDRFLTVSAPLHARVLTTLALGSGAPAARTSSAGAAPVPRRTTVRALIDQSRVPRTAFSLGMRKQLRPRGPLAKRLTFDAAVTPFNLAQRMNADPALSAAPVRESPPALDTHEKLADAIAPNVPGWLGALLGTAPSLRWLLLWLLIVVSFVLFLALGAVPLVLGVAAALFTIWLALSRQIAGLESRLAAARSVLPAERDPAAIDGWPRSPDFRLAQPGETYRPSFGATDSEAATRFKAALKDAYRLVAASAQASRPTVKPALDLAAVGSAMYEAVNPAVTIPRWVWGAVSIPGRIAEQLPAEQFVEAMAYPEIDVPMYKPLVKRSSELFLPNIHHIAPNSISLLETNQAFIEAYMVGLNHEFARELLWREYPTDQRGSYFRQFWEPAGFHTDREMDAEELKEKLRDIPPIHLWSKRSKLGDHDHRELGGDKEEEVVLVIRGELLKKYPTAVIYAQRAVWKDKDGKLILEPNSGQVIDPARERDLRPLGTESGTPPRSLLKTPLYEAKVDPDIYFFGFDLTVCKAKGGTGKAEIEVDERCAAEGVTWDDPGWFFVIKERPGEPRFGLDVADAGAPSNVDGAGKIEVWNDFAWEDVKPAVAEGEFLRIDQSTPLIRAEQLLENDEDEKQPQQTEDRDIRWSKQMSSAELAYVLYQVPVLVGVHAAEMLPDHPE